MIAVYSQTIMPDMATDQSTDKELSLELRMIFGPRLLSNLLQAGRELVQCDNGKLELKRRNDKWLAELLLSKGVGN